MASCGRPAAERPKPRWAIGPTSRGFTPREPFRSGKVISSRTEPATSDGCTIKGNRGSNGWIYHVPGMPYYDRKKAEEMFCTEAQARTADYRRAKVR